jgi:hypothetical protein
LAFDWHLTGFDSRERRPLLWEVLTLCTFQDSNSHALVTACIDTTSSPTAALLLLDSRDHCVGCFTPPSAEDPFFMLILPLGFGTTIRAIDGCPPPTCAAVWYHSLPVPAVDSSHASSLKCVAQRIYCLRSSQPYVQEQYACDKDTKIPTSKLATISSSQCSLIARQRCSACLEPIRPLHGQEPWSSARLRVRCG